jgi:hypothetical protein
VFLIDCFLYTVSYKPVLSRDVTAEYFTLRTTWIFTESLNQFGIPFHGFTSFANFVNFQKSMWWYFVSKIALTYCEKKLKFKAEGREFEIFFISLEWFIQTVKGQTNFWNNAFLTWSWRFLRSNILEQFKLEKIIGIQKSAGKVRKAIFQHFYQYLWIELLYQHLIVPAKKTKKKHV